MAMRVADLSGSPTFQQYLLVGAIVIGFAAWIGLSRRRAGGPSAKQYRREIDAATREQESVRRELADLLAEIESFTRRSTAELDARMRELRELLAEAERTIATLRGTSSQRESSAGDSQFGSAAAAPHDRPAAEPIVAAVVPPSTVATERAPTIREVVYTLADAGATPVEIAQRTGRPRGEIELMLNLRAGTPAATGSPADRPM